MKMSFSNLLIMILLAIIIGSVLFLATWDIPTPTEPVEKVIPDETLPH